MKPAVSIIVAVYAVESYIERCVRSLFSQTFKDFEIIFVDDASPDGSIRILESLLSENTSHIPTKIVTHPQNLGLSAARVTGLNHASGEYILMVDSDDYIEPETLEIAYREAVAQKADIVIFDFLFEYKSRTERVNDYLSTNSDEHLINIISKDKASPSLCNKLITKTLYLQPECINSFNMKYMEDLYVSTRLFFYAKKIIKIDAALYHYNKTNQNSITNRILESHFTDTILYWNETEDFLSRNGLFDLYADKINYLKIRDKIRLIFGTTDSKLRKKFATMFATEEAKTIHLFKPNERIMLFLVRHSLFLSASVLRGLTYCKSRIFSGK